MLVKISIYGTEQVDNYVSGKSKQFELFIFVIKYIVS